MSTNDELAARASIPALDCNLEHCRKLSFTGERAHDLQTLRDFVAFSRHARAAGYGAADERVAAMRRLFAEVHGEPR